MKILITIPTWNEAPIISRTLDVVACAAKKFLAEHEVFIEIADNGSTDGTGAQVAAWIARATSPLPDGVQWRHGERRPMTTYAALRTKGKGLAIRRSWERHLDDCDILLFMDADLAADLSILPRMVQVLESDAADIVCGSRFVKSARVQRRFHRECASRVYRLLQHCVLRLSVEDAQCGLKAISSRTARTLLPLCQETGWMFDSELLFLATRVSLRIVEIPVAWVEQRDPTRRSALKLFRDGWGFLLGLARIRLKRI